MAFKCLNSINKVVADFNAKDGKEYIFDEKSYEELKKCCDIIDSVIERFCADNIKFYIDRYTRRLCIRMECSDISLPYPEHPYFKLSETVVCTSFSVSQNYTMVVDLIFTSLWKEPKERAKLI